MKAHSHALAKNIFYSFGKLVSPLCAAPQFAAQQH